MSNTLLNNLVGKVDLIILNSVIHHAYYITVQRAVDLDAYQQHFFRHAGYHAFPLWES